MGHIVIPRNIISNLSRKTMWVMLKKNPKYWVMVSASLVAAPSCAISTAIQKMNSYEHIYERANMKLMKNPDKYEKFLRGN